MQHVYKRVLFLEKQTIQIVDFLYEKLKKHLKLITNGV